MSKQAALQMVHDLEELGVIVQRESDESLVEALEELDCVEE